MGQGEDLMSSAGRTAAEKVFIDAELEALSFHWGDAYEIEFSDEDGWRAKRRDGLGGWLTGADSDEMYKLIGEDYSLRRVPRSCTPG
jgi:hypothetical protein